MSLRFAFANMDFVHGGDRSLLAILLANADAVLLCEAKDHDLLTMVPSGWQVIQNMTDAATAGSAILVRAGAAVINDQVWTLGAKPIIGGQRVGMLPRWICHADLTETATGSPVRVVAGHWPPGRFKALQPGYTAAMRAVCAAAKPVVLGADVNQPFAKVGDALGLEAFGEGIVGLFADTNVLVTDVKTPRLAGSDHPVVTATMLLPPATPEVPVVAPPAPTYVGPAKWYGSSNNKPINRIVMHATVGVEPGVDGAARATVAGSKVTPRPSSYHYVADAKESLQYVYDSVVAYGAPPNEHSIHYELCCSLANKGEGHWTDDAHQAMLHLAAKDVAQLCAAYDVPVVKLTVGDLKDGKRGLCGHIDVTNAWHQTTHWDPGPFFPWNKFLAMVEAASPVAPKPDPQPNPKPVTRGAKVDHALQDLEEAKTSAKAPVRSRLIRRARRILAKIKGL